MGGDYKSSVHSFLHYRNLLYNQIICLINPSWAVVTPVKYEQNIEKETNVLIILKNWEGNGTEEICIVTPHPRFALTPNEEDKLLILQSQYRGCWWHGNDRSQGGISKTRMNS